MELGHIVIANLTVSAGGGIVTRAEQIAQLLRPAVDTGANTPAPADLAQAA